MTNTLWPMIGIIGQKGRYGQWLTTLLQKQGYTVIGSDTHNGSLTNQQVVERADVVIFSVPPSVAPALITELQPHGRRDQLWLDITSVKQATMAAFANGQPEFAGLHPMCAPPASGNWRGQPVVVCEGQLSIYQQWLTEWLQECEANVITVGPEVHDKMVAMVQALPHLCVILLGMALRSWKVDLQLLHQFQSPFYRIVWALVGRLHGQSAQLYADIQTCNPAALELYQMFGNNLATLAAHQRQGNNQAIALEITTTKEYLGEQEIADGFQMFENLFRLLSDLENHSNFASWH